MYTKTRLYLFLISELRLLFCDKIDLAITREATTVYFEPFPDVVACAKISISALQIHYLESLIWVNKCADLKIKLFSETAKPTCVLGSGDEKTVFRKDIIIPSTTSMIFV